MNYKKLLIFGDNHGRFVNQDVVKELVDFKKDFKPDITIHLGDNFDFSCLRAKATEQERKDDLVDDFNAGLEFLETIKPNYWVWGNHDKRVLEYLHYVVRATEEANDRSAPNRARSSLEELGADILYKRINDTVKRLKIITKPYGVRNSLKLGKWNFTHGYSHGDTPAKQMVQMFGNVIFGDVHHFSQYTTKTADRHRGYSVGSLCRDEDMLYQLGLPATLRHENGWGYGYMSPAGDLKFEEARMVGGRFLCPTLS